MGSCHLKHPPRHHPAGCFAACQWVQQQNTAPAPPGFPLFFNGRKIFILFLFFFVDRQKALGYIAHPAATKQAKRGSEGDLTESSLTL